VDKKTGLYVIRSDEPGYAEYLRAELHGAARLVREQFLEDGVIGRVYQVGPVRNPMVTIGPGWFQNAVRDYSNWRLKWWRECIQNSVDAGAKNIWLSVKEVAEGFLVSCEDDGKGMTREIMMNKFLVLGETGKEEREGQIGGFGKAKELLIMPWVRWHIASGDTIMEGAGQPYEERRATSFRKGTLLEVVMPRDLTTTTVNAMEFLNWCAVKGVRFFINGEQFKEKLNKGSLINQYEWGDIYHNKKVTTGRICVRINGVYMFSTGYFDNSMGTIIVETKGDSTKIFTANRDGFKNDMIEMILYRLANEVATEGARALQKKSKLITQIWKGTSRMSTRERALDVLEMIGPLPPVEKDKVLVLDGSTIDGIVNFFKQMTRPGGAGAFVMPPADAGVVEIISQVPIEGQASLESFAQQLAWQPDFMVKNEIEGFSVPARFKPEKMVKKMSTLAMVWAEACRWVFLQLRREATYGVGFLFSDDARAMYVRHEDRSEWLLLNPYADSARQREYSATSEDELKDIYAMAIHECTHMSNGELQHNSSFAAALTFNMAKCVTGWPMMKRIAKAVTKNKKEEPLPEWQKDEPWEAEREEVKEAKPAKPRKAQEDTGEAERQAYNIGVEWAKSPHSEAALVEAVKSVVGRKKSIVEAFLRGLRETRGQ
jgi:hypothetical protein